MIRRGHNKSPEFLRQSANTLASINSRVQKLVDTLDRTYSNDTSKNYFIKKLKEKYNPYMISEAAVDPRYTTYTVDKRDMHICLRTRDKTENIYDINLLMYVVLHELAHLCNFTPEESPVQGHGNEFKSIFKFLVQEAIKAGIYRYTDYSISPQEYCNITIMSQIL
jgi:predicted metal-dependent hydrolase